MGNACCQKTVNLKSLEEGLLMQQKQNTVEAVSEDLKDDEGNDESMIAATQAQVKQNKPENKTMDDVQQKSLMSVSNKSLKQQHSMLVIPLEAKPLDDFPSSSSEVVRRIVESLPQITPIVDPNTRQLGPHQLPDGFYEGQWKGGVQHGWGKMVWNDGTFFEGQWQSGKLEGVGRIVYLTGDIYTGQFHQDKKHGDGEYALANGAKYNGQWYNDLQHGEGQEIWPDGSTYKGAYHEGAKQGQGIFKSRGNYYTGQFVNNKMDGFGKFQWSCGKQYEGYWKNSKMHGQGVFIWPDGRKYVGEYVNDTKDGHGVFTWPDGKYYDGQWKDGKQHGRGTFRLANDPIEHQGEWFDGKLAREDKIEKDASAYQSFTNGTQLP